MSVLQDIEENIFTQSSASGLSDKVAVSFCILEMLFKNNFNVLKVLDIK
jgi:hypothetical protein